MGAIVSLVTKIAPSIKAVVAIIRSTLCLIIALVPSLFLFQVDDSHSLYNSLNAPKISPPPKGIEIISNLSRID